MKNGLLIFVLLIVLGVLFYVTCSPRHIHVSPYYRKDGTFVPEHYRTALNETKSDNWSEGNLNPYKIRPLHKVP